jgi:hypothetical protein
MQTLTALLVQLVDITVSLPQEEIVHHVLLGQPSQILPLELVVFLAQHVILAMNLLPVIISRSALLVKLVDITVYLLQD